MNHGSVIPLCADIIGQCHGSVSCVSVMSQCHVSCHGSVSCVSVLCPDMCQSSCVSSASLLIYYRRVFKVSVLCVSVMCQFYVSAHVPCLIQCVICQLHVPYHVSCVNLTIHANNMGQCHVSCFCSAPFVQILLGSFFASVMCHICNICHVSVMCYVSVMSLYVDTIGQCIVPVSGIILCFMFHVAVLRICEDTIGHCHVSFYVSHHVTCVMCQFCPFQLHPH